MFQKQNIIKLDEINYRKEIESELESNRELNALFLLHGYIEAFLLDWFLVSGPRYVTDISPRKIFSKEIMKNIEQISFFNLLHIHLILGNIDYNLYEKIKELNENRNKITHNIIEIGIANEKTRGKIKKIVSDGIKLCDVIFKSYKDTLDKKKVLIFETLRIPEKNIKSNNNSKKS